MKKTIPLQARLAFPAAVLALALLSACSTIQGGESTLTLYDFGTVRAAPAGEAPAGLPPLSVADANVPTSMRGATMFYRLAYANDQQPMPYAHSRWNAPPAQLFVQRLKARIGRAGGTVLPASDGAINIPLLRIDADDFSQIFDSPGSSVGQVALRASVFQGRTLIAQKSILKQVPAQSADAAGGARALADASDAAISDILSWLAGLSLKR